MAPANWLSLHYTDQIRDNIRKSMRLLGRTIEESCDEQLTQKLVVVTGVPHYHQYTGEWSTAPHDILGEIRAGAQCPLPGLLRCSRAEIRGSAPSDFYRENDPTHFNGARRRPPRPGSSWSFLLRSGVLP